LVKCLGAQQLWANRCLLSLYFQELATGGPPEKPDINCLSCPKHPGNGDIVPDSEEEDNCSSNDGRRRYLHYNGDSSIIVLPSTMMVPDSEDEQNNDHPIILNSEENVLVFT
jgi:hypothetical protein